MDCDEELLETSVQKDPGRHSPRDGSAKRVGCLGQCVRLLIARYAHVGG